MKKLLGIISLFLCIVTANAETRILVYGDSNTWGWIPATDELAGPRFSDQQRWAGVLQQELGSEFAVTVNGLVGRTVNMDLRKGIGLLQGQDHNGAQRLALALAEAGPIDLVVVMLGTNDLMDQYNREPADVADGIKELYNVVKADMSENDKSVRMILLAPPPLGDTSRTSFRNYFGASAIKKSQKLAMEYRRVANALGITLIDTSQIVQIDGVDGLHLSLAMHQKLGKQIAVQVKQQVLP